MSIDAMKRALEAMESVAGHVAQTAPSDEWAQYCGAMSALRELIWQELKEWQGLTDEEVNKILDREIGFNSCFGPETNFARAIESKLREKNT